MNKYQKMFEKIRSIIQINLDEEMKTHAFAVRISEVLKKFDGKKVTRRMVSALQKAIPEHASFYNDDYDLPKIIINKIKNERFYPTKEENKITFFIGGGKSAWKNPNFDYDNFVNHESVCYFSAAEKRCEKRRELLKNTEWLMGIARTLVNLSEAAQELFNKIENPEDFGPDMWDILQMIPFEFNKRIKI